MALFDHIAIAAGDLATGAAAIEAAFGVPLEPGGSHAAMGTHNRLLSLGPGEYLEVIAIDPAAPAPDRPRWFALDGFAGAPAPRATILRCAELAAGCALAPVGIGAPMAFARGDLRWQMAVPGDGFLPYDGMFPALIAWEGAQHPAARLPDRGVRLVGLDLVHPRAEALRAALSALTDDLRFQVVAGATPALAATFDTPRGTVRLA
jgi:hypothetical protein